MDSFKKCDLHLHSSSCHSRSYNRNVFLRKLESVDLDVISITDHNIIDVDLYKEIYEDSVLGERIKLIGGVELNIALDDQTINNYNLEVKGNFFHAILWYSYKDIKNVWEILKIMLKNKGVAFEGMTMKQISSQTEEIHFSLNKLQDKLKNINYFLVYHESKGARNLSDYLPNTTRENRNFKENLFYYNNRYAVEGGQKSKPITDFMEKNLEVIVSKFLFSDAKTLEEIGQRYTWINFDGNFESLKIAFSDPESRAITSDVDKENPQKNLKNYLEAIKIHLKQGDSYIEKELSFSPGLNGIIGSRGSGKTLLASVLSDRDKTKYKNFIDINQTKFKMSGGQYSSESPRCHYLSQSSLISLYEDGEIEYIDFIQKYYKDLKDEKLSIIDQNTSIIKRILDFEKGIVEEFIEAENYKLKDWTFLTNEINSDLIIKGLNNINFEDGEAKLHEIERNIELISDNIELITRDVKKLNVPKNTYSELETFNFNFLLSKHLILNTIKVLNDQVLTMQRDVKYFDKSDVRARNFLIQNYQDLVDNKSSSFDPKAFEFQESRKLALKQLVEITKMRSSFIITNEIIDSKVNEMMDDTKTDDIDMDGKTLQISTTIDEKKDWNLFLKDHLTFRTENIDEHMFSMLTSYSEITKFKTFFNGTKYKASSLKNENDYISRHYQYLNSYIDEFIDFSVKLIYEEKELDEYSPGRKTEILLDLFLNDIILENNYVYLVLDQPEDNMDTKTITENLILRIRELKSRIQIFIVSHSATVIINGDSDNIIYAEENNHEIGYVSGNIIDTRIKNNIVTTLDGGEKNLKMRLNKYDFNIKGSEIYD